MKEVCYTYFSCADELSHEGRVCAYSSEAEHWLLARKLEVQGRDIAQMRALGGKDGSIPWQKVTFPNYLFYLLELMIIIR